MKRESPELRVERGEPKGRTGWLSTLDSRLATGVTRPLRLLGRSFRLLLFLCEPFGRVPGRLKKRLLLYAPWVTKQVREISASGLFDRAYYLKLYPDVARAGIDPVAHYLVAGAWEGRDPHALFDSSFYLENHPDVAAAGINPLAHYLAKGASQGYDPHPQFDSSFYLARYPDVAAAGLNPLVHYVTKGASEGREARDEGRGKQDLSSSFLPCPSPHGMAGRTLFIDACTPTPDQDSGSRTALDLITSFQRAGYKATFVADNLAWVPRYTADLELQDIKCLYSPYATSLEDHLKQFGRCYDLIVIFRAPIALKFLYLARQYAPQAKIIFHTIDLHYLREQREAELRGSHDQLASITLHKAQELAMVLASDCTIVVSQFEKDLLAQELPRANVYLFPYVMDVTGCRRSFGVRQDLVFLGGYRHPPNVDAVCYFVDKVFPLIRRILPEVRFLVVGSHAPPEVLRLAESDGIEVVGQVPDLAPYFEKCRLSVAPLRYGAGIKGKVVTSLSFGLPCVATSIAVEGMAVEHGKEVLIADDPHAFAERVIDVYTKPDLWQSLSQAALRFVERNYSRAVALQHVQAILASIGLVCPKRSKEEEPLRVAA